MITQTLMSFSTFVFTVLPLGIHPPFLNTSISLSVHELVSAPETESCTLWVETSFASYLNIPRCRSGPCNSIDLLGMLVPRKSLTSPANLAAVDVFLEVSGMNWCILGIKVVLRLIAVGYLLSRSSIHMLRPPQPSEFNLLGNSLSSCTGVHLFHKMRANDRLCRLCPPFPEYLYDKAWYHQTQLQCRCRSCAVWNTQIW